MTQGEIIILCAAIVVAFVVVAVAVSASHSRARDTTITNHNQGVFPITQRPTTPQITAEQHAVCNVAGLRSAMQYGAPRDDRGSSRMFQPLAGGGFVSEQRDWGDTVIPQHTTHVIQDHTRVHATPAPQPVTALPAPTPAPIYGAAAAAPTVPSPVAQIPTQPAAPTTPPPAAAPATTPATPAKTPPAGKKTTP